MHVEIANKLDTRAEYIRQLTQSLSREKSNNTGIALEMADDVSSVGGDTVTSVLLKYGKDTSLEDAERDHVRSSGSFIGSKHNKRASSSARTLDSIDNQSGMKSAESMARESSTAPLYEDPHTQFLINKEQNRGRSTGKLVSGSQFRNTTKLGMGKCEQCTVFDRVNKKHKETIRSLRLQIARLEETAHDLRRLKANDMGHHVALKGSSSSIASGGSTLAASMASVDEEELEDIQYLANKCETYEADLAKMKKMLIYERTLNEGLRKTLDETRTGLREELASAQLQVGKLAEEHAKEKERREGLQVAHDDLAMTLLRYKQQLERTENKLSDCQLQLNAQKNSLANVDHLKEIERLRHLLSTAEASNQSLAGQLSSKAYELSRTHEKLATVEGQIASLEEKKAAAEVAHLRAQNELKDAQDLVNATKKHSAVLQDTLTQTVKEKDVVQRALGHTQSKLEHTQTHNATLQAEVASVTAELSEMKKQMAKDAENTKKALEKAITASVRLCVVAPTVNVHVSDKKLKFKAGLSQDSLKSFLSNEVLEKYSFLFKQKGENSAPDGSGLEQWLQTLLGQMQTSIEQHVNSAMDGSSL
eukprot:CAMPEP_0184974990 /NCGR_PEP_ID=MMETSP1098-20130426/6334_1 /TAXON_ID=89044 /ORGANISM="Spumella elongata, Strain CCAP 955/1" /LENGTH=590 /DNA_ID=CAMNT_0027497665 /DNA_START=60 /DNA_END=1835 /DNA_ORIENTATION=-